MTTFHALTEMLGSIAVLALLAVAYGSVVRAFARPAAARAALGALFGGAAVFAMLDPLPVAPGIIVDMRAVPMVLAGAYLGWPGAVVAAGIAAAMRIGIGGAGMACGVAAALASAAIGLAWARLCARGGGPNERRDGGRAGGWVGGRRRLALLAAAANAQLACAVLLPPEAIWSFVAVWPVLIPFQTVGIFVVGSLLERERALADEQRRLAAAAARDPLTGLLNRRGFEAATRGLRPGPRGSALLLLDLDRFKQVNDAHGHAAGDAVLGALGARLAPALRPQDVVARLGGEELAVFLPGLGPRDAQAVAERLCAAVREEPFALPGGGGLAITASVGGAWSAGPVLLDVLAARADAALYAAKGAGRDRCSFDGLGLAAELAALGAARPVRAA